MPHILGLGDNTIDTYVDAGVQYPGGNAVNVAAMTARLGANAAYLGCLGNDEGGILLRDALTAEGVDLSRIRVRPGPNARAYIGHVQGDRHFIRSTPGVRADYQWEQPDFDYIARFDHVHTSIYSDLGDALPRIASSARSLSIDLSTRWSTSRLEEVLPYARFVFLSAADFAGPESVAIARECLTLGPEAVIITRGSAGALGYDRSGPIFSSALSTSVVDTLGAGDGFISGFLMAILQGRALRDSLASGAEFASRVCGWQGGFGHALPWRGDSHEKDDATQ